MNAMKTCKYIEHKRTDPWPKSSKDLISFRISIGYEDDMDTIIKGIYEILENL